MSSIGVKVHPWVLSLSLLLYYRFSDMFIGEAGYLAGSLQSSPPIDSDKGFASCDFACIT